MKNRMKVAIPHLTGGLNNKLNQLIEFAESLNHPVFMDNKGNHLTPNEIVAIYEEAQTANDRKPVKYIYYVPNNEELARRNPAKMSKKKTNAREKYMANLLGGKDGNDLLNLASKVGSRKAAVELLKSGNTRSPFNVEIPMSEEDEIQALAMQGLTPSNDALVDQAYRKKLENQIVSYLADTNVDKSTLAQIDKGVLITDESIEDFRQMLTVYHLAHQMNGPLANSIKGHVPRSKSQVFDRLIPSFDDILAGENLVLFANQIIDPPTTRNRNLRFSIPPGERSSTLIPPWLDLADPNDSALRELRDSLGDREVESFLQLLAGGDLVGAFQRLGQNTRELFEIPLNYIFGIRRVQQDDRQARMFDDLVENITDALVSDFGRGRGYTNRKELAKAVVHATEDAYDKRVTDVFSPLRATVNAARRVRRFSPSGATMKLGVDFNTFDAGDVRNTPSVGQITPGVFYIGNFDFRIPPIGWNRKWMVATAQIVHEYWNYIRPHSGQAANAAFMPIRNEQSLNLPQILYLIAIRTKELYNYDLAPEEWLVLIAVLGGNRALTENYYRSETEILEPIEDLIQGQWRQLDQIRQDLTGVLEEGRRARRKSGGRAKKNPTPKSALPMVDIKPMKDMKKLIESFASTLQVQNEALRKFAEQQKTMGRVVIASKDKKIKELEASRKKHTELMKKAKVALEKSVKKIDGLERDLEGYNELKVKIESDGAPAKIEDVLGGRFLELMLSHPKLLRQEGVKLFAKEIGMEFPKSVTTAEARYKYLADYIGDMKTDDPGARAVSELATEIVDEKVVPEIVAVEKKTEKTMEDVKEAGEKVKEAAKEMKRVAKEVKKGGGSETKTFVVTEPTVDDPKVPKKKKLGTKLKSGWLMKYNDRREEENTFVKNLDAKGKIGVVFDTHADWKANMEIIEHMETNHGSLNHVVWAGDCFDSGRGYASIQDPKTLERKDFGDYYTPGEDDIKNWDFTQELIDRDEDKYIFLMGNHDDPDIGTDRYSFWQWAKKNGELEKYKDEVANLPFVARAGPVMICHGGFPLPVLYDPPKPTFRFWNDPGVWNRSTQMHTIWNRPNNGSKKWKPDATEGQRKIAEKEIDHGYTMDPDFEYAIARFGINTMITGHSPSINYGIIGKPAYESETFIHISGQSSRDTTRKPIYAILDFDTKEITIEIAEAITMELDDAITALNWVETATEKMPTMILNRERVPEPVRGLKKNPPGSYHEYEDGVIDVLIDEGGAAGLSALRPAFPPKTTKTQARNMLKQMSSVVLHKEGDYILVRGISNPMEYAFLAEGSIKGTKIQTSPGPKGENCGSCIYLCPTSARCSKWSEMAGRPVFVLEDWYCKAYEARPKMNKPIGAIEIGVGVSLIGGVAVAGKLIGPYVSHLLAKHREKKLSEKIVGDIVGELKPLIERMDQKNEEAIAYTVAKQMTPQQVEQLEELKDEMGDEIEPEVEEFFDEIIEQSEVEVRYHIIETPHGTYKYDEEYLMMEVPVGDDDKVMSWIENNMQDDNPNLYHDVTIEGDTATYKLKKKARKNVPFDTQELKAGLRSTDRIAFKKALKDFAEKHLDEKLKRLQKNSPAEKSYLVMYGHGLDNKFDGPMGEIYPNDFDDDERMIEFLKLINIYLGRKGPYMGPRREVDLKKSYRTGLTKSMMLEAVKNIEEELASLYNVKSVKISADWRGHKGKERWDWITDYTERNILETQTISFEFTMKERRKRNNPQLPACSYRKSKRAKACGGKLRAKKNPKGRIVCTDCGAEYEMR